MALFCHVTIFLSLNCKIHAHFLRGWLKYTTLCSEKITKDIGKGYKTRFVRFNHSKIQALLIPFTDRKLVKTIGWECELFPIFYKYWIRLILVNLLVWLQNLSDLLYQWYDLSRCCYQVLLDRYLPVNAIIKSKQLLLK